MEIIKIGNDSMKISLCNSEAKECGFSGERTDDEIKRSFIDLLLKAKRVVDFRVAAEKLVGEMFSANDGGCEIFVSRVEVVGQVYKERYTQETAKKIRQTLLCIEDVEHVVSISKMLSKINSDVSSALYLDESSGKYYIILDDVSVKDIKYVFLTEYSTLIKSNYIQYIKEHCRCICKKEAVKNLARC